MGTMAAKQVAGEICVVCDRFKKTGIHLYTSYVCTDCETDIIHTHTEDPKYGYYLSRLRNITTPE